MNQIHRWIPVDERLPDDDQPVYVSDNTGNTFIGCYFAEAELWIMLFGYLPVTGVKVSHWQPLPAPPRVLN